jgi:hypothetical protein
MKTQGSVIEGRGWRARSVLDCGSLLPLLSSLQSNSKSARGLAQSKTWRSLGAALSFHRCLGVLVFGLLTSALILSGHAQSLAIDWYTIESGGGTSASGAFSLTGTIAQPDAGAMSGENYTLAGGFWSIMAAVQTPGAPTLTIRRAGNSVEISWPAAVMDFVLEATPTLSGTVLWSGVSEPPNVVDAQQVVTVPLAPGNRFFRLHKP